ncbi:MAG: hypothetical protein GVY36_03265, partial [Verrucomicrobia bacterium]|nr:hypothetical protein [Verrucomicrobiota bacterium]
MMNTFKAFSILISVSAVVHLGYTNTFDPDDVVNATFTVGDQSGSHSERWTMIISGGPTDIRHQSEDYGVPGTDSYNFFRLGKSYSVTVDHAGTHSQYKASANDPDCEIEYRGSTWCNSPSPDYDYVARVQPQSVGFIIQDENTPALLGTSSGNETNEAAGKTARFGFPKPVVSFPDYTEEEVEGDPGVLVLVNDNDSNEDDEIDKDEPFANDPDYVEISLKLELEGMTVDKGTARLSANRNADLRVWDPADWSTPHNLPLEWDMATPEATSLQGSGKTLFIEALAPSDSHKDFTLTFEYTNDGTTSRDTELTLLKVDLEIEDEHFADNIMDTAETDEDLEQFIMARGSTLNPDPFEIT